MPFFYRLLVYLVLALPVSALDRPQESGFSCGLNAAYIFLNRAGHHVDYDVLSRDFSSQKPPDTMLAIKAVLEMHGCRIVGIKADASYFLTNVGPAIVYLQLTGFSPKSENHFSYLAGASRQGGVQLLDPIFNLGAASYITWDGFVRAYQGVALVPQ